MEGSGDDDDLGQDTSYYYYEDDGDDDGILVSWTLQLYGHDAVLSTPQGRRSRHPKRSAATGSKSTVLSISPRDGIYERAGECEGVAIYEDNGTPEFTCGTPIDYWYVGNDPCQDDYAAAYVYDDDADLVSLMGTRGPSTRALPKVGGR